MKEIDLMRTKNIEHMFYDYFGMFQNTPLKEIHSDSDRKLSCLQIQYQINLNRGKYEQEQDYVFI